MTEVCQEFIITTFGVKVEDKQFPSTTMHAGGAHNIITTHSCEQQQGALSRNMTCIKRRGYFDNHHLDVVETDPMRSPNDALMSNVGTFENDSCYPFCQEHQQPSFLPHHADEDDYAMSEDEHYYINSSPPINHKDAVLSSPLVFQRQQQHEEIMVPDVISSHDFLLETPLPDLSSVKTCPTPNTCSTVSFNSTSEDPEIISFNQDFEPIDQDIFDTDDPSFFPPLSETFFDAFVFFEKEESAEALMVDSEESNAEPDNDTVSLRAGMPISSFLTPSERTQVSDFTNAVVDEMQVTYFKSSDRKGSRALTKIGFTGMSCRHCDGSYGRSGRYFPSSIKTISDSKKSLYAMHKHLDGCQHCPDDIKFRLEKLLKRHIEERKVNRRQGSQRRYFRKIWTSLHPDSSST